MPQPGHFPWGLPGALPSELTVGMERGSVVEFLPNIQRSPMDHKTVSCQALKPPTGLTSNF